MKQQRPETKARAVSSVQPSAHLPSLTDLETADWDEQRTGLAAWIAWLNGNQHRVDAETERRLDELLQGLDREAAATQSESIELRKQFDSWLDSVLVRTDSATEQD